MLQSRHSNIALISAGFRFCRTDLKSALGRPWVVSWLRRFPQRKRVPACFLQEYVLSTMRVSTSDWQIRGRSMPGKGANPAIRWNTFVGVVVGRITDSPVEDGEGPRQESRGGIYSAAAHISGSCRSIDQFFRYLNRIERGSFSQVVRDDPQVEAVRDGVVPADSADEGVVESFALDGERIERL